MAYEDDPPEFTGTTQERKADPKGKRVASAPVPSVGIYGNKSEVTMRGAVSLGVQTIGQRAPLPATVQEQITETVKVAQLAPTTDTPEQYEPEVEPVEIAPEPEPERVIRDVPTEREKIAAPTPRPMGVAEVPLRAPRNALEADLFEKLRHRRTAKVRLPVWR